MQQRKPLTIYDLETLIDAAERIISTAQFNFMDYDEEGNYIVQSISHEDHSTLRNRWLDGMKKSYLCFRYNEELHDISFQEAIELPLATIKDKYLKDYLYKLRNILRKDSADFIFQVIPNDIPDSYLDDLLALRWKENLKLWTIQWGMKKKQINDLVD